MSSFGEKALQILRTVAPTVALAVGGPFGPLASAAISAALGTPKGDDKAAEAALLTATPDQLLALTKANNDFQVQMKQLGIDEEKLVYDDIANARARNIALRDSTPAVLVYLTTTGFFSALIGAFLITIPDASKAIVYSMIGSLGTVWITQMGFYFGSSMGSASKTDVINKIAAAK
jgi:hypothetical protein